MNIKKYQLSYLISWKDGEFMKIVFQSDAREFLEKNSSLADYLHTIEKMDLESSIATALIYNSRCKNLFLDNLYYLANINIIDKNYKFDKKITKIDMYTQVNELCDLFLKEYFKNIEEGTLYIGILELIWLEINYYSDIAKKILQIDDDKYYQMNGVLSSTVISKFSNYINLQVKGKSQERKNSKFSLRKYSAEVLTEKNYQYNPLVGNTEALRRLEKKLLSGNSAIVLGDAGVGKTTLVEGLAYQIQNNNVPSYLKYKQIISLPIGGMVADTKYVGTLEDHILEIINYAKKHKETIFFIDELHTIMGAGQTKDSNIDVSNLLKPHISNKTMQIIGATTKQEYDETIAKNPAFRRRFDTIELTEPNEEEVYNIVSHYIIIKEQETNIKWEFSNLFLKTLIHYTSSKNRNYFETINNPNITLKILDDIFASTLYYDRDYIIKQDVIESIIDNDILSSVKRDELIRILSNDAFYVKHNKSEKSKILRLY